jgi:uncharacterized protein (TIGR02996 family)
MWHQSSLTPGPCLLTPEMPDTLDALHHAVVASPQDRTVRLVYADALDETGDPVEVARAEFIRAQVDLEAVPEPYQRHDDLAARCAKLFDEHWLAWWAPVAEAAGLPPPHVPGKRVRDRLARAVRRGRRPANWPYSHTTTDTAVHLTDYGLSFRFAGGFPEEVRFLNVETPARGPELVHRWGDAVPLTRLAFAPEVTAAQWARVDGPHLARLADLTLDRLPAEVAPLVARSPHLAAVTRLSAGPVGSVPGGVRELVSAPIWDRLQTLCLTSRLSPDSIRELARGCTLAHLEELDLTLGDPGLLGSPVGEMLNDLLHLFLRAVAFPATAVRWAEFGPALEALAAAPWVGRLRRLALRTGNPIGLRAMLGGRLYGSGDAGSDAVPDAAVLALAAALDADKLERLVLPAAVVGPSAREELTTRLGGRVAFA